MKMLCCISMMLTISFCGASEILLQKDFSNDEAGLPPPDGKLAQSPDTKQIIVVKGSEEQEKPFGGGENLSLRLRKETKDQPIPRITWDFSNCEEGTLSFKMHLPESDRFPNALLSVFLMTDKLEQRGPDITLGRDAIQLVNGENHQQFALGWDATAPHEIKIRFFQDQTYSVEIDGQPTPDDRRFAYRPAAGTHLNAVQFAIAWLDASEFQAFVDDILLEAK